MHTESLAGAPLADAHIPPQPRCHFWVADRTTARNLRTYNASKMGPHSMRAIPRLCLISLIGPGADAVGLVHRRRRRPLVDGQHR